MPELWPPLDEIAECTALVPELSLASALDPIPVLGETHRNQSLSPEVLDEIRRISRSATLVAGDLKPGMIVLIDARRDVQGRILQRLAHPVAFCLERTGSPEAQHDGRSWAGWIAAPEVDYATCWDVLLEPDDEPFDPQAGMIQTWNHENLWVPSTSRVLAALSPERLAAIQDVSREAANNDHRGEPTRVGWIHLRETAARNAVLTGTPLNREIKDTRISYQALYRTLAKNLSVTATNESVFAPYQTVHRWITQNRRPAYALAASVLIAVVAFKVFLGLEQVSPPPVTLAQAPIQHSPPGESELPGIPKVDDKTQVVPSDQSVSGKQHGPTTVSQPKPVGTHELIQIAKQSQPHDPAAEPEVLSGATPAPLMQLAFLDPSVDLPNGTTGDGGVVVRGAKSKNDGFRYFTIRLKDPARLPEAKALFEEMTLVFKVLDSSKGKVLIMGEASLDFVAIDRRVGESQLFSKRLVSDPR